MFSIVSSISSVITKRTGISIEPCPDPGAGDLLWYKFDNTNGVDNATSGQLKNYAGTQPSTLANALINAPTLNSRGTNQTTGFGSVTLGSSKYIAYTSTISMALPRTNGFTISCWLKIPSNQKTLDVCVFAFWNTNYSNSFPVGIRTYDTYTTAFFSVQGVDQNYKVPRDLIAKFYDDNWHLYTVTLNVSSTTNLFKWYFDGVYQGSSAGGGMTFENYANNFFGYLPWGNNVAPWTVPNLQYADVRIYKTELSASKIRGLYRDTANNHP